MKTMGNSPAMMPWFPNDFLGSTLGWSLLEKGLYRVLLDAQWMLGQLPSDLEELRLVTQSTKSEFSKAWQRVAPKFVLCDDGYLRNLRLEEHRRKSIALTQARAESGRRGGIAKALANDLANLEQTPSKATSKTLPPSPSPSQEEDKRAAEPAHSPLP